MKQAVSLKHSFFSSRKRMTEAIQHRILQNCQTLTNNLNDLTNDRNINSITHFAQLDIDTAFLYWKEPFVSPFSGTIIPLSEVRDPVFSSGEAGVGFAVIPSSGEVVCPVNGIVRTIFPMGHTLLIETDLGKQVIVHMGLEAANKEHEGFLIFCKEGDIVHCNDILAVFDIERFNQQGKSTVSPVFIPNIRGKKCSVIPCGKVKAGDPLTICIV